MDERDFGEGYYLNDCGRPYQRDAHWTAFFGRIADDIVAGIRPRRVLDAGCAMGLLVEALRDRGVEAFGFDLSSYAITRVPARVRECCWQASVTDEIEGRYDLIVCIIAVGGSLAYLKIQFGRISTIDLRNALRNGR